MRNLKLKEYIQSMNTDLPNNVYLPMGNWNEHRVLWIVPEYSLVLHSNEKAPFHILIEVESLPMKW